MSVRTQRYRYSCITELAASLEALDRAMTIEGSAPPRRFCMDLKQASKSPEAMAQEAKEAMSLACDFMSRPAAG